MGKRVEKLKASCVYYYVSDMDRAVDFYTKTLALPLRVRFENYWAEVEAGPITIGLHPTEDGKKPAAGGGTISFSVKNFDAIIDALKTRGAKIGRIHAPERGRFTMISDPDGNQIHIVEFNKKWMKANSY
jgi:predicted enzyme related to lactoylglutathione lyase